MASERTSLTPQLPRLVAATLTLSAVIGIFIGGLRAGLLIRANHYLELGMLRSASHYLRTCVAAGVGGAVVFGAALVALGALSHLAMRPWVRDAGRRVAGCSVIAAGGGGLAALVLVGLWINRLSWFVDSPRWAGLAANLFYVVVFGIAWTVTARRLFTNSRPDHARWLRFAIPGVAATLFVVYANDSWQGRGHPPAGKNVLLITVDTLRADHLGCYGYARDTSPNIDRLAAEGVRFDQAVVQWPKTGPSFASMLSGTYGHRNGVMRTGRQKVRESMVLLAESLLEAGYETSGVVTNGNLASFFGFDRGFEHYQQVWRRDRTQRAETVTGMALDWLARRDSQRPFLLWLHYVDPHAPYEPPPPHDQMFIGDGLGDPRVVDFGTGREDDMHTIPQRSRIGERRELGYYVAQYDAEIHYMDAQVGRVLNRLRSSGLDEETLVVLTADHGESLGDHEYYFEHGRLPYDASSRAPLIIKVPGMQVATRNIEPTVELINVLPTILDLVGAPVDGQVQGVSMVTLLRGRAKGLPRYAFTESGYQQEYQRSIRDGKWKLIYVPDPTDQAMMQGMPFELYNVKQDPHELHNLFESEPRIAEGLARDLMAWVEASRTDRTQRQSAEGELSEDTLQSLRSLGYVD